MELSRRQLLFVGAAAGGGFLVGWHRPSGPRILAAAVKATPAVFAPNAFIRIGRDGRITLIMNQVEMGQGTYTSMPMLLAEELEVGLDQVHLEHAPPDDRLYSVPDRKSTRLNSSHLVISYAVFCLKKKNKTYSD